MIILLWAAIGAMTMIGVATELATIYIAIGSTWKRNIWLLPTGLGLWLLCVWGCVECLIEICGS